MVRFFKKKTVSVVDNHNKFAVVVEDVDLILGPSVCYKCYRAGKTTISDIHREYDRLDQIDRNIFDSCIEDVRVRITMKRKRGKTVHLQWTHSMNLDNGKSIVDQVKKALLPLKEAVQVYRKASLWWKMFRKIAMGVIFLVSVLATAVVIFIRGKR